MKILGRFLLFVLSLAVAVYAVVAYSVMPLGDAVHPDMKRVYLSHQAGIYTHVFAASVALLLGPLQFSSKLRNRFRNAHRWLGRTYLGLGVLLGGLAGLYMSTFAYGGMIPRVGFACSALVWLYTGLQAYRAIRRGQVAEHRKWMVRNFAVTFSAVTLRIYLGLATVGGIPFDTTYLFIAWLSWVPNLIVAELLFNRQASAPPNLESVRVTN